MVGIALAAVPTVLGAVRGARAEDVPFGAGMPAATRIAGTGPALSASALRIGSTVKGSMTIRNTGDGAGRFDLQARIAGSRAFAKHLMLTVSRGDGAVLYAGPLTGLGALNVGRLEPGGQLSLDVQVTLRSTGTRAGDNLLQGRSASADFSWSALQL